MVQGHHAAVDGGPMSHVRPPMVCILADASAKVEALLAGASTSEWTVVTPTTLEAWVDAMGAPESIGVVSVAHTSAILKRAQHLIAHCIVVGVSSSETHRSLSSSGFGGVLDAEHTSSLPSWIPIFHRNRTTAPPISPLALAISAGDVIVWEWSRIDNTIQVHNGPLTDSVIVDEHTTDRLRTEIARHLTSDAMAFHAEHQIERSGGMQWLTLHGTIVRDQRGNAQRMAGSIHDHTRIKTAEDRTLHDSLTGLPNRELLNMALAALHDDQGSRKDHAVLTLDLVGFTSINDGLGHRIGDEVLRRVAGRLQDVVGQNDLVARIGSDEFAILWREVPSTDALRDLASLVLRRLQMPLSAAGHALYPSAVIGLAMASADDEDSGAILRDSLSALAQARAHPQLRAVLFDRKHRQRHAAIVQLDGDLRQALGRGEFLLHYQPIVNMRDNRLVGVEALVRWNHPVRGLLSPGAFIERAEETGLIVALGEWTLRTACQQLSAWRSEHPTEEAFPISVNLSPLQFMSSNLTALVKEVLAETGLKPTDLRLELTEHTAMGLGQKELARMATLRALGVSIVIDDFGTGYSSLQYLTRLPVDALKIDRAFISRLELGHSDARVVDAIISLAQSLNLGIVAEGIETEAQMHYLLSRDCAYAQGFLFSEPLPPDRIPSLVARPTPDAPNARS